MAITLNGTTGISSPGGDTSTSLATTNLSYTGTLTGGTGVIAIGTNQIYKDASGNVGIGIASPSAPLHIYSSANSSAPRLKIQNPNTGSSAATSALFINDSTAQYLESGVTGTGWNDYGTIKKQSGYCIAYGSASTYMTIAGQAGIIFGYGANPHTEAMRIDSSGNLLVGTTSVLNLGLANFYSATNAKRCIETKINTAATSDHIAFFSSSGQAGQITVTGTTTAYGTGSDYRLKENIKPLQNALSRVALLKPSKYIWKADQSEGEGFIAHELQEVVPQAVTGEKDGEQMQGVDYGKLTPLLTAAIQELTTRLAKLEAK